MTGDNQGDWLLGDLEPGLDADEAGDLVRMGERLRQERPVPRAAVRGDLRRHLLLRAPGSARARPRRLRLVVAGYLATGAVLLLVAALGAVGSGPLA